MFKFFFLAAFVAVAAARPSYLGDAGLTYGAPLTTIVAEPTYAKVGSFVKTIPTAVSHQSISQVHSGGHYVQPIVAPVYSTYEAPAIQTYAAAPLVKSIATPYAHGYGASPLLGSSYTTYGASPLLKSYASGYGSHYDTGYGYGYGHGGW